MSSLNLRAGTESETSETLFAFFHFVLWKQHSNAKDSLFHDYAEGKANNTLEGIRKSMLQKQMGMILLEYIDFQRKGYKNRRLLKWNM